MRFLKRYLGILLFILFNPLLLADNNFEAGIKQFEQKNYQAALKYFLLEEKAGNESAQLWFNIGSSFVKEKDYTLAKRYYSRLLEYSDWKVVAYFYLAIIAEKTGDEKRAENYYLQVSSQAKHLKLKRLAQRRLGKKYPKKITIKNDGIFLVSMKYGVDSNPIALSAAFLVDSDALEDSYAEALLFGRLYPGIFNTDNTYVQGYVLTRQHNEFFSLNTTAINGGIFYSNHWQKWRYTSGIDINFNYLDDAEIYNQVRLSFELDSHIKAMDLSLRFQPSYIDSAVGFGYLSGTQHQFQVKGSWNLNQSKFILAYLLELNDRDNLVTTDNRFSYSPTKHILQAQVEWSISNALSVTIGASISSSEYSGQDKLLDSDQVLKEARRTADLSVFEISAEYKLSPDLLLTVDAEVYDNRENFELYTFDRRVISIGLRYQFPN